MGKPAARIGDHHVCPMVTGVVPHVGGPVVTAQPNVLIAGRPAARIGDNLVCAGPPDTIAQGEPTVLIGGKPAARLGDSTVHGGKIVIGAATVLIGGDNSVTLPNWRIKKHNDPSLRPKMEDGSFKTRREVDMKNSPMFFTHNIILCCFQ